MSLPGGWRVQSLVPRPTSHSAGPYSVSYLVEREDGVKGFLKALDYSHAFRSPDPALALNTMTAAYLHERHLLQRCAERKLRRVVRALDGGSVTVPGFELPVNYIVFERADRDLRSQIDAIAQSDDSWRLKTLHQIATALLELHSTGIAHQDLKAANVLQFGSDNSKVGDLGRSVCKGVSCPYESDVIPGTRAYAPPELLYSSAAADFSRRRFGCDAYLLGSMAIYLFTGMSATSLLISNINESHRPKQWRDGFEPVLPYLKAWILQSPVWPRKHSSTSNRAN
jgi:eukaryotic-like serine/threonine-protein kinase